MRRKGREGDKMEEEVGMEGEEEHKENANKKKSENKLKYVSNYNKCNCSK